MTKKYISLQLVALLLINTLVASCGVKKDGSNALENVFVQQTSNLVEVETGYSIEGELKNRPNNLLVLFELNKGELVFMDSIRTNEKGKFSLKGNLKESLFCQLQWGSSDYAVLLLEPKSKIKLEIDPQNAANYAISGEGINGTVQLKELLDLNSQYSIQFSSIESQFNSLDANDPNYMVSATSLQQQYYGLLNSRADAIRKLATSLDKSLIPYFVVAYEFLPETDITLVEKAFNAARNYDPNSKYTQFLQAKYNSEKGTAIGSIAPDFSMAQPDGTQLKLSDLKGKYVLLDFWASWCRPCRAENPNNVRMYKKYASQGFEILSVSLDDNKGRWLGAIQADSMTWKHVSQLQGWSGSVNQNYKVTGIPMTFLLDKEGKIIAKNLRGPGLEAKLNEIFTLNKPKN